MKKHFLLILIGFFTLPSYSQCIEDDEATILLVGDSWAFFMNADGTFNTVLEHWGHTDQSYYTNSILAVNGARSEDFLEEARLTELENQLTSKPNLKAVHLSISGNDFLGAWHVDDTPEEVEELSDETFIEVTALTDFIHSIRPDIQIVFSGYMYANFEEIINDVAPFEESHPFYASWEEMGFPTFPQINELLNDFSQRMFNYSLLDDKIDFIFSPAYMQYVFGQEEPLGVDPGGTYAPFFQPLPFGDLAYPSPKESMRDYGIVRDCFHLSAEGFYAMIDYQFQKLYHKLMMDDAYFLSEIDSETGNVTETGVFSTEVTLGNSGGEDIATILSFNTTTLPDTLIEGASIFLRMEAIDGGLPFGSTVMLSMKHGNLGSSPDLDSDDFSDFGDIQAEACVFGVSSDSSDWIRIELPESFLPLIASGDITQFSIKAIEAEEELIIFSNAANPEFAPVLNLKFKSEFLGLEKETIAKVEVLLYPNPTSDYLNIRTIAYKYNSIQIINTQGQLVYNQQSPAKTIDISALEKGHYIIQLIGDSGIYTSTFIKN